MSAVVAERNVLESVLLDGFEGSLCGVGFVSFEYGLDCNEFNEVALSTLLIVLLDRSQSREAVRVTSRAP